MSGARDPGGWISSFDDRDREGRMADVLSELRSGLEKGLPQLVRDGKVHRLEKGHHPPESRRS
jgi:hypothetical protein